jgi:NADH-quinone oxidoreductase subunit K
MMVVIVPAALFCLGLYGVLTRRDLIAILACVELMLGAANIQLVAFAKASGSISADVHVLALVMLVLAAAEAAVGLAILLSAVRRTGKERVDELTEVQG